MRLAVVVPSDDLDVMRTELQYLGPTLVPQEIRREYPILAVGHFGTVMGEEPRGYGYKTAD